MSLEGFLIVAALLFVIGFFGVLTRRNGIALLMCLELMFNAVNLTAVALGRYVLPLRLAEGEGAVAEAASALLTGQIFAIFVIVVAAAEVALGLAIVLALYRSRNSVDVTEASLMRN